VVREATIEDLPHVLSLFVDMHRDSDRYKNIPLSIAAIGDKIKRLHLSKESVILIDERDGEIVGMFWGMVDRYFFSTTRFTTDVLLYVVPKSRNGFIAYRLVKAFEQWSESVGVQDIQVGVSTGNDNEAVADFYTRLGYTNTGIVLSKRIG
jgi:GNAT superfamily N-acetyltransferase